MRTAKLSAALFAGFALTLAATSTVRAQVAITEFMIDPYGSDLTAPEWIELFNYGASTVNLNGWTIKDNSSAAFTFPDFNMPSGSYAIVSTNHVNFVTRWLGGVSDPRVIPADVTFQLNNTAPGGDGLYLRNASTNLVWSLGYSLGADPDNTPVSSYHSTYLAIDDFTTTDYGTPPQDGTAKIVRAGNDLTGTLGYEDITPSSPHAYGSAANLGASEYGSPLLGDYTAAVPEPASLSLLAATSLLALRRRK